VDQIKILHVLLQQTRIITQTIYQQKQLTVLPVTLLPQPGWKIVIIQEQLALMNISELILVLSEI
jgi:hypothetical protein